MKRSITKARIDASGADSERWLADVVSKDDFC